MFDRLRRRKRDNQFDESIRSSRKNRGFFAREFIGVYKLNTFYLKKRCVFLVNLKTVLTEAAVKMFYHEMALNEISVFLLENTLKTKLEGEKITIIDRDLCEIVV